LDVIDDKRQLGMDALSLLNAFDDVDELIFLDACHVWDKGNLILAKKIIEHLNELEISPEKLNVRFKQLFDELPRASF